MLHNPKPQWATIFAFLLLMLTVAACTAPASSEFANQTIITPSVLPNPTNTPTPGPMDETITPTPTRAMTATDATTDGVEVVGITTHLTTTETPTPAAAQPVRITGALSYTSDIFMNLFVEDMVLLVDMHSFVMRDPEWVLPVEGQVLGFMELDRQRRYGTYELLLPAHPQGTLNHVSPEHPDDTGVQIFAVAYAPNLADGPYSIGNDLTKGWPSTYASIRTDADRQNEVIGGKLIVWAPDDEQEFPAEFGEDRLLFTDDDPVRPLPAGYSVVNLDTSPFTLIREPEPVVELHERPDFRAKDLSNLSYTEAMTFLFTQVRREYAFVGIPNKEPDWDRLQDELTPLVERAEAAQDPALFCLAVKRFVSAFQDGHVQALCSVALPPEIHEQRNGGYGFAVRTLSDGTVIASEVQTDHAAAEAGMEKGAEIIAFNGTAITRTISTVTPTLGVSFSSGIRRWHDQERNLTRAPAGTEATVTFINPDASDPQTATLTSAAGDFTSFSSVPWGLIEAQLALQPVEFEVLDSGIGYINLHTYMDDLNLIYRLFERALRLFDDMGVPGIIVDLRYNGGGAPLGLAGHLTNNDIEIGEWIYYNHSTGLFESQGTAPLVFHPLEPHFSFDTVAVLIGPNCASACEAEAYGFSQVENALVVGHYPTAGMFGEVGRGQYRLPDDTLLVIPTGRPVRPDGSLLIEDIGIVPSLFVPVDRESVLLSFDEEGKPERDPVLETAEEAILSAGTEGTTAPLSPTQTMTMSGELAPSETVTHTASELLADIEATESMTSTPEQAEREERKKRER